MNDKIPPQRKGASTDTVSEIDFESSLLAKEHYTTVKKRFLDVNSWELFAGEEKAEFSHRNAKGELLLTPPQKGDYFTIKVPGLHYPTADGYDWVQVEVIEEEDGDDHECVYIRVRPVANPTIPDETTAHFFDSEATSNFLIKREGTKVSAEVHGRNEVPNVENLNVLEKIRNSLVAIGGMIAGSKFQWSSFTDGLIKHEK